MYKYNLFLFLYFDFIIFEKNNMSEITTKKVISLSRYISKSQFAKLLQISRSHFYDLLNSNEWKDYQIDTIDNIYNKVSKCDNVTKICIEDKKLCIYSIEKTPVTKLIYPI